jgi:hypothetical protein
LSRSQGRLEYIFRMKSSNSESPSSVFQGVFEANRPCQVVATAPYWKTSMKVMRLHLSARTTQVAMGGEVIFHCHDPVCVVYGALVKYTGLHENDFTANGYTQAEDVFVDTQQEAQQWLQHQCWRHFRTQVRKMPSWPRNWANVSLL